MEFMFGLGPVEVFGGYSILLTIGFGILMAMQSHDKSKKSKEEEENTIGRIIIDHSDPDGPYMFLEVDSGLSELAKRKKVYLDVVNDDLTRE